MTLGARKNERQTIPVWDLPVRLFHWSLVGAITIAFLSSAENSLIAGWHTASGWVAAVLIAFRLVWGLVGGKYARFANFIRTKGIVGHLRALASGRPERSVGHNPAGGLAIVGLLALTGIVVFTGVQLLSGGEEDFHEATAYALLGLIVVHVAAVIATSLLTRENLVAAMVTGRKIAAFHPGARNPIRSSPFALLLAVGVMVAAVIGATRIDPSAFAFRSLESAESGEGEKAETGVRAELAEGTAGAGKILRGSDRDAADNDD